jgi:hypothetical protein
MHLLLALAILFVPGSRVPAPIDQANADPLLNRLAGRWAGDGIVVNQPSKISLSWSWELNGQFLKLSFRNEMPKQTFEGHAYYRPSTSGGYRGMWFDNSGMFRPLEARRDGDALVSKWGTPDTEEGETTYRLLSDTRMDIIDRVKSKDGTWREFGRSTVERIR